MAAGALIAVTITAASAVLYADLRFPAIRAERPLRPISRRSAASRLRPVNSRWQWRNSGKPSCSCRNAPIG